jgi:exodeoxyribonuclease V alpha subunit
MADSIDVHKVFAEFFPGFEPWAYAVSETLGRGSICLDINQYQADLLQNELKNPFTGEAGELDSGLLNTSPHVSVANLNCLTPFILEDGKLYMHRYYTYQVKIAQKIKGFIDAEEEVYSTRIEWLKENQAFIDTIFPSVKPEEPRLPELEQVDWQKTAALMACLNNFTIITGGPGTGKTTTVARILAILFQQNPDLKVALAAPTGKAATRMAESLHQAKESINGIPDEIKGKFDTIAPRTLHRLLEKMPESMLFRHNAKEPLEYDLVVIDEASMVDTGMMYKMLEALRPHQRIIFLGDKNQLASVEAGSIFGDLCRTQQGIMNHLPDTRFELCHYFMHSQIPGTFLLKPNITNVLSGHVIQLYHNYRVDSQIISTACSLIIENDQKKLIPFLTNSENLNSIELDPIYDSKKLTDLARGYIEYIREPDIRQALRKINRVRVLCAVREGKHGIYMINRIIEKLLKSETANPELFGPAPGFYHNQLIMVTSNNYDLGVFNGDTGIIRRKSDADRMLYAYFESENPEKPKEILPGYLNDYEAVYAMTIHKSQGSEFESVAVILPENENAGILTRELLYTAVSRAKRHVLIQSPENVLLATAEREVSRASGISNQF